MIYTACIIAVVCPNSLVSPSKIWVRSPLFSAILGHHSPQQLIVSQSLADYLRFPRAYVFLPRPRCCWLHACGFEHHVDLERMTGVAVLQPPHLQLTLSGLKRS